MEREEKRTLTSWLRGPGALTGELRRLSQSATRNSVRRLFIVEKPALLVTEP